MIFRLIFASLLSALLATAGCRVCDGQGELDFEIGTGTRHFEPLDLQDPSLPLVRGPQGGSHLDLGFRVVGERARAFVRFIGTAMLEGEEVAGMDSQVLMRCNAETALVEATLPMFVYDFDSSPLRDQWLDISVEAETEDGRTATQSLQIHVRDR